MEGNSVYCAGVAGSDDAALSVDAAGATVSVDAAGEAVSEDAAGAAESVDAAVAVESVDAAGAVESVDAAGAAVSAGAAAVSRADAAAAATGAAVAGLLAISCRIAASRALRFLARSEFGKAIFEICCWTTAKRTSAERSTINVGFAEACAITNTKKSAKINLLIFTDLYSK